ncbi:MAG TPA: hypothetical protein ENI98_00725 [Gammaproteobacteria bacterium]|nr:hypothetical protein [Gammaproteobacteria bacterium]
MKNEAAEILAKALEEDAIAQESGNIDDIGLRWDDVYAEILPLQDVSEPIFAMAMQFWDGWVDASNHEWQYHKPVKKEQWPIFARELADCLRSGTMPANQMLIDVFSPGRRTIISKRIKK